MRDTNKPVYKSCLVCVQGQESNQHGVRRSAVGEQSWLGKPQQACPPPGVGSPRGQSSSGETSRGHPPVPDPTGTEDSPLSQVSITEQLCTGCA